MTTRDSATQPVRLDDAALESVAGGSALDPSILGAMIGQADPGSVTDMLHLQHATDRFGEVSDEISDSMEKIGENLGGAGGVG
jgi:hypothetical protein